MWKRVKAWIFSPLRRDVEPEPKYNVGDVRIIEIELDNVRSFMVQRVSNIAGRSLIWEAKGVRNNLWYTVPHQVQHNCLFEHKSNAMEAVYGESEVQVNVIEQALITNLNGEQYNG